MALKHEVKKIIDELPEGWTAKMTKGNHWQIRGPQGQLLHAGNTVSDHRAVKNIKARIKRAQDGRHAGAVA